MKIEIIPTADKLKRIMAMIKVVVSPAFPGDNENIVHTQDTLAVSLPEALTVSIYFMIGK